MLTITKFVIVSILVRTIELTHLTLICLTLMTL